MTSTKSKKRKINFKEKAMALATKVYENVQKERSNDDNNSDSSSDNDGKEHVTDAEFEEK